MKFDSLRAKTEEIWDYLKQLCLIPQPDIVRSALRDCTIARDNLVDAIADMERALEKLQRTLKTS